MIIDDGKKIKILNSTVSTVTTLQHKEKGRQHTEPNQGGSFNQENTANPFE